jgi:periplasmic copper chaperone A
MNRVVRLITATCAAACSSVLIGAGIAEAHIETDPPAVAAGSAASVGFNVEHGCDGSNTTELQIKIPDGVTDAVPVDKPGWTSAVAGDAVTFSGGDLDATTPDTFQIAFTAPAGPGTIYFPIVQTCQTGETAWIEIPAAGAAEPDHPAPAVLITDGPPTSADLTPHDDDAAEPTEQAATDSTSTDANSVPIVTTTTPSKTTGDDESSNTGVVLAIVGGAVVVLGGAAVVAARRRRP